MKLFSSTFDKLENALSYSTLKQKVISQNIANVDTPNYKAKGVSFKAVLHDEINSGFKTYKTDNRHVDFSDGPLQPGVFVKRNFQYGKNGNGVDMDKEMADLAANQIYYSAVAEQIKGKFSGLQNVIRGGK